METQLHSSHWKTYTRVLGLMAVALLTTSCAYMKMDPPPDVDKANLAGNNSCYLATASNMLAGAGYGDGNSVQARADDIYSDLTGQFGIANSGWTDTALSWWLTSNHNTWTNNPYTVVTVFGNKIPKNPWANANGARDIRSNRIDNATSIPNVTGGYVVASFDLLDEAAAGEQNQVGQYRLMHQYSFDQSPESHTFTHAGQQGLKVTNLRFGHTYGLLKQQQLWAFADWMTDMDKTSYTLGGEPVAIDIDWQGRLSYPEGENVFERLPDIKKGLMKEKPEEVR